MRVGINLINFGPGVTPESLARSAELAESLGYHLVMISDHVAITPDVQALYPAPFYDPFITLGWLTALTRRVELGTTVIILPYRHPLQTARMAANLDRLSGGRLILGIGAGWYQHEYEAYGYEYPETPERLRMLRESLQVLKAMWTQESATFEGRYYKVRGAINEPKPVQKPHPPIWIGGAGEKVTLKLVAQYGDACNFNADVETVRHKLEVLRGHCDTVGRDYDSILKTIEFYTILGDRREIDRVVADHARRTGKDESYIREWHPLHGDADRIAEIIQEYADQGIQYFIVNVPNAAEGGVIARFAQEVFPKLGLRAGV